MMGQIKYDIIEFIMNNKHDVMLAIREEVLDFLQEKAEGKFRLEYIDRFKFHVTEILKKLILDNFELTYRDVSVILDIETIEKCFENYFFEPETYSEKGV